MKISLKGFILPKNQEQYSDCADNYAFHQDNLRFAISDGVSRSFFPKIWSEILVKQYVSKSDWEEQEFIDKCQKEWQQEIDQIVQKPNVMYYIKNAYVKKVPACATFLGLQILQKQKEWICEALGDTFLFFVPHNFQSFEEIQIVTNKPEPIEFDNYPDYWVSIGDKHKGTPKKLENQPLTEGTFYLMTDALAEWVYKFKEEAFHKFSILQNQSDFEQFIQEAREKKEINDDDTTLMIIQISEIENENMEFIVQDFYHPSNLQQNDNQFTINKLDHTDDAVNQN